MNNLTIVARHLALLSLALALAAPRFAAAQVGGDSATITGTVTTEGGVPLSNARVTIPSLQLATTTNDAGTYRIGIPAARFVARGDTLRVVRLGFRPENVGFTLAPGRVVVDIVMRAQAVSLERVLVSGVVGNQERRAQSAVVATIDASDVLREAPVSNVTQLLSARVPGVIVTEGSGVTGTANRILIRGAASISLSNQPLVFIDGVRVDGGFRALMNVSGSGAASSGQAPSTLNDLNPDDIETIEIVKGPAAATLYGADASAGVIQIITKRGRVGSRSFTQDLTTEYDVIEPNFTFPTNYAKCTAALILPASSNPLCRGQELNALVSDNPAERLNFFRDGWMGSAQYNVRGGGDNFGYFASFSAMNEQGTTVNNILKQRSGRGAFTFVHSPKLTFDLNYLLAKNDYDLPRSDQDTYGYYVNSAFGTPLSVRTGVLHPGDTDSVLVGGTLIATATLESLSSIVSRSSALRTTPSVQVRYAPLSWFTNRLTLGADVTQADGFILFPKNNFGWYPDRVPFGNDLTSIRQDDRFYTADYLGNIRTDLGTDKQFSSDLSFGSQYISRTSDRLTGSGSGIISNEAVLVTNAISSTVSQGYGESRSLGLFVQEQVGFRNRLFLQAGFRADRNSAFGAEVGTFYLPKVGASWVVSQEPFWRNLLTTVPTLRVRAAYGTTGRSPSSGGFRTFAASKFVNESGGVELGVTPSDPGNPDLKPERGKELEAGFEAGFFSDRVGLELTYFNKKSKDLIVPVPIAPSAGGFSGGIANIGEVENSGFEFLLRANPLSRPALTWDVTLSGATLHNEILEMGTVGTLINNFRAFTQGRQIAAYWAHRVRSVDVAGNRVITSDTAEFIGNQLPTFQATLTNSVTLFRNFRLYALLESKRGYYSYNVNQENRDRARANSAQVQLPADQGGYSPEERLRRLGPYFGETTNASIGFASVKDPYVQKADHVRLREVSVTWMMPAALLRTSRVSGASLTLGGRNLALWKSEYEGDDPDVLGLGGSATGFNQLFNADVFTTPPSRRYIVRLNIQF